MGGDFAPEAVVLGAILAQKELPADVKQVLFGPKDQIEAICKRENEDPGQFEIVNTTQVI